MVASQSNQVDENGAFLGDIWNKRSQFVPPDLNYRCVMDELRAADTEDSSSFSVSKTPIEDILPKVKAPSLVLWSLGVVGLFDSFGWKIGENRALVGTHNYSVRALPLWSLKILCSLVFDVIGRNRAT
mmetsp:Transcript_35635/g.142304  ORF Transcript_35635/g.142304 Transcript_35635/m.142304 type:complete len:128 (-) Transcript_35635:2157-2540(-)